MIFSGVFSFSPAGLSGCAAQAMQTAPAASPIEKPTSSHIILPFEIRAGTSKPFARPASARVLPKTVPVTAKEARSPA